MTIPFLPSAGIWLGAVSPDPEARVFYSVSPPDADIIDGFLDLSGCESGSEYTLLAIAKDRAGNVESRVAQIVVEEGLEAWLNTALRGVRRGATSAIAPVSALLGELGAEGASFGIGAEVSSSLAEESGILWRIVCDCVFVEVCPVFGRGLNGGRTLGVCFRGSAGVFGAGRARGCSLSDTAGPRFSASP